MVIDVEPFRAALRDGDWKLVWQATLPSRVELYDLKADPGEKNNLAAVQPERVARMQARLEAQAKEAAPPLFFKEAVGAAKPVLFGSVATPAEVKQVERQPLSRLTSSQDFCAVCNSSTTAPRQSDSVFQCQQWVDSVEELGSRDVD